MSNIVKLKTWRYEIDWSFDYDIVVDIVEYVFFSVEYRLKSWHLVGHKCDKDYNWTTKEISYHWVAFNDLVDFIVSANNVKDNHGNTRCRVSRFNSLHYSNSFYSALSELFKAVEKKQAKVKELEEN